MKDVETKEEKETVSGKKVFGRDSKCYLSKLFKLHHYRIE